MCGELKYYKKETATLTNYNSVLSSSLPPSSSDLSDLFPPPGNQNPLGACWAFATTYAYRSFLDNQAKAHNYFVKDGQPDLNMVYSPEFSYQYLKGDVCDNNFAQYSYEALDKILHQIGAVKYNELPYSKMCNNYGPAHIREIDAKKNLKKNYQVFMLDNLHSLKVQLSQGIPLILCIDIDNNFRRSILRENPEKRLSPVWDTFNDSPMAHAIIAVAYNDTINAVKILNSWGSHWGNEGYAWISYKMITEHLEYACYAKDLSVLHTPEKSSNEETDNSQSSASESELEYLETTWFKEGYFRPFNDLRIDLNYLDVKKKFAIINITDTEENILTSFYCEVKSSKEFYVGKVKYIFTFNNIGHIGWRYDKQAVFYTIERIK